MILHALHRADRVAVDINRHADVCIVVEGCYPYVAGGVSSWVDWLMRTQPELTFSVVSVVAGHEQRQARYPPPTNMILQRDLVLQEAHSLGPGRRRKSWPDGPEPLASALTRLVDGGGLAEFREVIGIVNSADNPLSLHDLLQSRQALEVVRAMYEVLLPHASFLQFYWAWRALFGGIFATLKADLPDAKVYHAISTGYAGLLAARAAVETGRPGLLTEHGIYTNERRIEILMADWISDTVDKGLNFSDTRLDLRDLWIRAFECYARVCYEACSGITTLYGDNQQLQKPLGAEATRLRVIANGIDVDSFSGLKVAPAEAQPTMALIGRVVPIKDTKAFIVAAAAVRREVTDVKALVMGPTDEDQAYVAECRQLVEELGVEDCVEFTGSVRIADWLPKIHVVVLTSLSEAQPLVLLEAGAAGIPCVATNVGACREIIDGAGSADDPHDPGGFVTDLVSPQQIADQVCILLRNSSLRNRLGEALRRRVRNRYATGIAKSNYAALYRDIMNSASLHQNEEAT